METGLDWTQLAMSAGVQAFILLLVWRMARRLCPANERNRDADRSLRNLRAQDRPDGPSDTTAR